MISTLNQYFFVTLCVLFLAGSLVRAGEGHGESSNTSKRDVSSVKKEVPAEEISQAVTSEDARKLLESYEELQSKLNPSKSGEVEE